MKKCQHTSIWVEPTVHAQEAGYTQPTLDKRFGGMTTSGRKSKEPLVIPESSVKNAWSFPAPLVLPEDELSWDAKCPPQSTKSWLYYNQKRPVTQRRKTIYVVAPPEVTPEVSSFMSGSAKPVLPPSTSKLALGMAPPNSEDLCAYLRAFYHGMEVKMVDETFKWQAWDEKPPNLKTGFIGLETPAPSQELVRVRCRASLDGVARVQLNLSDALDAIVERVPSDAYAIVMLVDQDLYEDEEDDFCCGRAYGESRIAIVSSFRYHPALDVQTDIDYEHMWPASHCKAYLDTMTETAKDQGTKRKRPETAPVQPIVAAIQAAKMVPRPKTQDELRGLWFSRVARTLAHEVGHIFGLDHCVYYACSMQGTANMTEDVRQPPYLCPVCLTKLTRALSSLSAAKEVAEAGQKIQFVKDRYTSLRDFCDGWKHVAMFAGFQAWIDERLQEDEMYL